MKRWLSHLATALSLVLALAAVAAWASSYTRSPAWRLIATAHSADLTRVNAPRSAATFTTRADWSKAAHHGFWDAWSAPPSRGLGFASRSDAHRVDGAGGAVSARAWMVTVPWWFIILVALPMPLLRLRALRRRPGPPTP